MRHMLIYIYIIYMPRVWKKSVSTLDYNDFYHTRRDKMETTHSPSTDFTHYDLCLEQAFISVFSNPIPKLFLHQS